MDHATRKELKTDHFVEEVGHGFDYLTKHKQQVARWGSVAGVVLAVVAGVYFFLNTQAASRSEVLNRALAIQETPAGPAEPGQPVPKYATEAERTKAFVAALQQVVTSHPSSEEGYTAKYLLATTAAADAKWSEAEKLLTEVADKAGAERAALARFALAQVYQSQNKNAEAEKLYRALADKPTALVSKEQAQVALLRLLQRTKPEEGKKLAQDLLKVPGAAGKAAMNALAGQ